jgi:hypothetical protein
MAESNVIKALQKNPAPSAGFNDIAFNGKINPDTLSKHCCNALSAAA